MRLHALQPYPAMRPSATSWIEYLPTHWAIRRLKTVLTRNESGVWGKEPEDNSVVVLRSTEQTVSGEWNITAPAKRRLTASEYRSCQLEEGDLVVTKSSGSALHIGKTSIVTKDVAALNCCFSNFMQRLRVKRNTVPRFIWYVLNGKLGREQLDYLSDTTTGLANISGKVIGRIAVGHPPLREQRAIVRFLDHADRRMRCYIRGKERLIELLEEQKQAIIHQAVTGQIDVRTGQPYPAYKDSGVEWLGEVPEHWSVRRNRWLFRERNETGFGSLPVLEVSLHEGVGIRDMEGGQRKQQMVDRNRYKRAKTNDIAYNTMRMWQGAVGVVPVDGLVSPAYVVMAPVERIESRYFGYLFRTEAYKNAVKKFSRGIVSDRDRLYWDGFKRIASFVPPLEEQTAIVHFLDDLAARTDRLAHANLKLMGWLTEWRESVISQVVTGKVDVREAAASLPEVSSLGADDIGRDPEGNVSVDPKAPDPVIQTAHP